MRVGLSGLGGLRRSRAAMQVGGNIETRGQPDATPNQSIPTHTDRREKRASSGSTATPSAAARYYCYCIRGWVHRDARRITHSIPPLSPPPFPHSFLLQEEPAEAPREKEEARYARLKRQAEAGGWVGWRCVKNLESVCVSWNVCGGDDVPVVSP